MVNFFCQLTFRIKNFVTTPKIFRYGSKPDLACATRASVAAFTLWQYAVRLELT